MSLLITLGLGDLTAPTPPTGGLTPYMNMLLPTVSVTLGPLYATEVNTCFASQVDAHDHTPGRGKLVPTGGLDMNANLYMAGFSVTNLDATTYNIRTPTILGSVGSLYFSGVDLYAVDGNGVAIRITASGSVNVTGTGGWTGDYGSGTSTASYTAASKTFALVNATGQRGKLSTGDILLRRSADSAATAEVTLLSPLTGATGSYSWIFPLALPGSLKRLLTIDSTGQVELGPTPPVATKIVQIDPAGVVTAQLAVDGTTLTNSGTVLAAGVMQTANLANGSVTKAKLANFTYATGSAAAHGPLPTVGGTPTLIVGTNVTIASAVGGPVHVQGIVNFSTNGGGSGGIGAGQLNIRVTDVTASSVFIRAFVLALSSDGTTPTPASPTYSYPHLMFNSAAGHAYSIQFDYTWTQPDGETWNLPAGCSLSYYET